MRFKTEEDLKRLIELKTKENQSLEYKVKPWTEETNKNPSHEAAKDISAFANTQGGTIIIGVEERAVENNQAKIPVNLKPFEIGNWEAKIDDINYTSIKPSIEGLHRYSISSSENGKDYLVIDIPESANAPHMDVSSNRYYWRDNTGAKRMSEAQIAQLYQRRQEQATRLEELYAPIYEKLKLAEENLDKESTQWFLLFLPRIYQHKRVEIYKESLLDLLNQSLRKSATFIDADLRPIHIENFIHLRAPYYSLNDYYRFTNIWLHESGSILVTSTSLPQKEPGSPYFRMNFGYLVRIIESSFGFISELSSKYMGNIELKVKIVLKNVGDLHIYNFIERYNENFWNWLNGNPFLGIMGNPRRGNSEIVVESYTQPWQLEEPELRNFLKKQVFLPILRGFGHTILDP